MPIQSTNPPELITLNQWKGLNQQARRGTIDDEEEYWNENLFAIGPGNLRSCWGHGPAIYTAPPGTAILRIFFGYYGNNTAQFAVPPPGQFGWMFLSNGHIDEVDLSTQAVTNVGPISSAQAIRAIMASDGVSNEAFIVGLGSNELPIGSILSLDVGGITDVTITGQLSGLPGYDGTYTISRPIAVASIYVNFYAVDPFGVWTPIAPQYWASAKVWRPQFVGNTTGQGGGVLFGSPAGLYAWDGTTLSSPGDPAPDWLTNAAEQPNPVQYFMPVGLPGIYAMEVYQSRLFVAGKDVISFSAPSNGADFSTTDGGGSFGYFGDKLTYSYQDLAESSGYLFVYGDSSIDMIANVQLTGQGTPESPFTTNLNYQNIDPQVGHRFPRPVGRIGRYMQMYNGAGIFECRGAEAREIGNKTINVYNTLDTSLYFPTMCPANMFGFKVLLCNGRFTDPFGVTRDLLLMWHPVAGNEFWSVASQNLELTNIGAYEQDSIITPYGTDGASLYRLFAQPDPNLVKRLATKYIRGQQLQMLTIKNFKRLFMELYDNSGRGVSFTGNFTTGAGGVPAGSQDVAFDLPAGQRYAMIPHAINGQGIAGALDISSKSPDFTLERIHALSEERTLYGA